MKRSDALTHIRIAGYHGDRAAYTRLIIENRVSKAAAELQYQNGESMKRRGVACGCFQCKEAAK